MRTPVRTACREIPSTYAACLLVYVILFGGKADASGSFDGVYKGTERMTLTDYIHCVGIDIDGFRVVIADNHFIGHWGHDTTSVEVAPDGTFDAYIKMEFGRMAEIKGKITGGKLEADVGTNHCAGHLLLDKAP